MMRMRPGDVENWRGPEDLHVCCSLIPPFPPFILMSLSADAALLIAYPVTQAFPAAQASEINAAMYKTFRASIPELRRPRPGMRRSSAYGDGSRKTSTEAPERIWSIPNREINKLPEVDRPILFSLRGDEKQRAPTGFSSDIYHDVDDMTEPFWLVFDNMIFTLLRFPYHIICTFLGFVSFVVQDFFRFTYHLIYTVLWFVYKILEVILYLAVTLGSYWLVWTMTPQSIRDAIGVVVTYIVRR